ncbi:FAD binding domain-containing protein [Shimia sp.]|uniref:FAD binding domain-containing protein n=1 Tax=Shimia sp. TaxID=1954381 RepID=UPI003298FDB6
MGIYHRPCNLKDALAILSTGKVTLAAGCTDLLPATERQALAGSVLDIMAIQDLQGVTKTSQGWRIGAAATWRDVVRADLPPAFDMLKAAARQVGSLQIQNVATVAGNLCNASPAADGVPPLLALDSKIELASSGSTRFVPLAEFVTGVRKTAMRPDEMVVAVHIPAGSGEGISAFRKLGARKYLVISIAMVAARLVVRDGVIQSAAIAVGACSPVAQRMGALEAALVGRTLAGCDAAVQPAHITGVLTPISDVRGSETYRLDAAQEQIRRVLRDLAGGVS